MAGIDASRFRKPAVAQSQSYADLAYWEARYQSKEAYDWYLGWEQLRQFLFPLLAGEDAENPSKEAEILVIGCGTSTLSQDLYGEGFSNVTNVDHCESLVQAMRERHQEQVDGAAQGAKGGKAKKDAKAPSPEPTTEARKLMQFEAADVQSLPKEWSHRFDVVIDKALLDSIACGSEKWKSIDALMRSVSSVLKPGGVYFCVSHAGPETRRKMMIGPHQEGESDLSEAYGWVFSSAVAPRLLASAFADPKAKEKAELTPGPAYDAEKDVYHIYTCRMSE